MLVYVIQIILLECLQMGFEMVDVISTETKSRKKYEQHRQKGHY